MSHAILVKGLTLTFDEGPPISREWHQEGVITQAVTGVFVEARKLEF
jgi:hypothetical protein